ncbi:GNAT family N-acetyltransferase [Nisaea sediminum]|uniref:GNAT family N-acetyltransferase n=1 Tax=Nisaea sediminum TaxID=2775867 RepID=UPI001867B93C|nr:GNAT family N-acetyltransferase [Nisaea sediminum]
MSGGAAFSVRLLGAQDAAAFLALRKSALEVFPAAFSAAPEDDFLQTESDASALFARREDGVVFGGFTDRLKGCVGLFREKKLKTRHKVHLWTMFVERDARGAGMGRALLEAAIGHAGGMDGVTDIHLGVSDLAPAARALYESVGFVTWGVEPRALRIQGSTVSIRQMVLPVRRAGQG